METFNLHIWPELAELASIFAHTIVAICLKHDPFNFKAFNNQMEELDDCLTKICLSKNRQFLCIPKNSIIFSFLLGSTFWPLFIWFRILRHYQGGIELYPNELMTMVLEGDWDFQSIWKLSLVWKRVQSSAVIKSFALHPQYHSRKYRRGRFRKEEEKKEIVWKWV